MHSTLTKKEIERLQLNLFKVLYEEFPDGCLLETEEPDFVLKYEKRNIGIEVTNLYQDGPDNKLPRQAEESVRYRIVNRAKELHFNDQLPPVVVSVHFRFNVAFQKSMIVGLSNKIQSIVAANIPEVGSRYEESNDWNNRQGFPEEIDKISIYRAENITHSEFFSPNAGFIPELEKKHVNSAIERKDEKYYAYRRKSGEVWLLLGTNGYQISSTFEICDEVFRRSYDTKFEKVFVVAYFEKKLFELVLNRHQA